ncbi:MAG: hypothetical protein RLY97_67 [Pseudomonadota bacterium]|jgi:hypothetical protein
MFAQTLLFAPRRRGGESLRFTAGLISPAIRPSNFHMNMRETAFQTPYLCASAPLRELLFNTLPAAGRM